jgi:voltage-gated potassium channel
MGSKSARPGPTVVSEITMPLRRATALVVLVFVIGTVGYTIIGGSEHGVLDALYMTVITLTTVGYGEVIDLTHSPAGRVFTIALLFTGVGAFLSFFSAVTAFFVEGSAQHLLWRRRMRKRIDHLTGHTVVCGGGHTGVHVVQELVETGRDVVLIEQSEARALTMIERVGVDIPIVVGDATEDRVQVAAGIERAAALVACISNDKDNLIATLSARLLNPSIRIVSRCVEDADAKKILKAGADAVVSVNHIGGLRLVSEAVRPTAVSYLDQMLRGTSAALRVESTLIEDASPLAGQTLSFLFERVPREMLLLALQDEHGGWQYRPEADAPLVVGQSLVYVGGQEVRSSVEALARPEALE